MTNESLRFSAGQRNAFLVSRSEAINEYSMLEQALCQCFGRFAGVNEKIAGTIFFKISNARARRDILDDLKRQAIGPTYTGYWDSLMKIAAILDERRNLIVHWATAVDVLRTEHGNLQLGDTLLKKPNYWAWDDDATELRLSDIDDFSRRCAILQGGIHGLLMVLRDEPEVDQEIRQTWREICQRPLDDPLPPDHPLYQKPKAL